LYSSKCKEEKDICGGGGEKKLPHKSWWLFYKGCWKDTNTVQATLHIYSIVNILECKCLTQEKLKLKTRIDTLN